MRVEQVERINGAKGLMKMWEPDGIPFERQAIEQIRNMARMPFVFKHVAVMPDAHAGIGSTVGTVFATKGAVVPAAVGVDIGCGMMAIKTTLRADQLPDNLFEMRDAIERAVPHGRGTQQQISSGRDPGSWGGVPETIENRWFNGKPTFGVPYRVTEFSLAERYDAILAKYPKLKMHKSPAHQLGTLGTGNHFIEVCLDENDDVWLMLHSGSRGVGNKIGSFFIERAKEDMARRHMQTFLPDQDLAFLTEGDVMYDDYMEGVGLGQDYARENRNAMMAAVVKALQTLVDRNYIPPFALTEVAINCHHNYVTKEQHFGEPVLVTRKGAVQAREGTMGIIPGSMATGSFIVRGLGNSESFCSCSHGAGRVMSRTQAKKMISLEDHAKATAGVECRKDADVIDESPAAYKNIGAVMAAQSDLVEIVYSLKQVVNVKG
jgi:tRNA-splicing ligase RtcB